MDYAVYLLEKLQKISLRLFLFGIVCYFISALSCVWILFDTDGSVTATSVRKGAT
jgi:hypothetical protein